MDSPASMTKHLRNRLLISTRQRACRSHGTWDMDEAMKKSTAKWKIAVGHHTMGSVSDHGDTQELLQLLLPVLKVNGIDFYINGHDHCLEHISSRDRIELQTFSLQD
ncbi:hypothetical protein E2562_025244 [Oryza meyeriana var. granulata]|uniref:Calcineurin-like phosphoesterase domain-containing protein n=1 Tax=Oryza meyeriana var. granulata TaxID=110450 RepID=A0A6G1C0G2_9ORYZ|nr:hypothetical protein E2562_025244 [Oryza meyeriana var. granulata]